MRAPRVLAHDDLAALVAGFPEAACVGVDMPIGLPDTGERAADAEARAFVGARRSSVFMTPPAAVLAAESYAEANVLAAQRSEKGISQQAWGLRENIGRVAAVAETDPRLIEVHPEVSFAALAGGHMRAAKTTWNGQMDRRAALAARGHRAARRSRRGRRRPRRRRARRRGRRVDRPALRGGRGAIVPCGGVPR